MSKINKNTQSKMPMNLKRIKGHINTLYDSVTKNIDFGKDVSSTKSTSHVYVLELVKQIRKCASALLNNERRFTRRKYNHSMDSVLKTAAGNPAILKAAKIAALKRIQQLKESHANSSANMSSHKNNPSTNKEKGNSHLSNDSKHQNSNKNSKQQSSNNGQSSRDAQTNLGIH